MSTPVKPAPVAKFFPLLVAANFRREFSASSLRYLLPATRERTDGSCNVLGWGGHDLYGGSGAVILKSGTRLADAVLMAARLTDEQKRRIEDEEHTRQVEESYRAEVRQRLASGEEPAPARSGKGKLILGVLIVLFILYLTAHH